MCGHKELTDLFHRPLIYISAGKTDKLIELLNLGNIGSYPLERLRAELEVRGIDWNTPQGRAQFDELLRFTNLRVYRGSAKSSMITHGLGAYFLTLDPNETIALASANDDGAWAFCRQIRATLQSELYQLFFPERIPDGDLNTLWTEKRIWMGGRTNPSPQWSLEARGVLSNWVRTHYNRFLIDDAVTSDSLAELKSRLRFLTSLQGLYMPYIPGQTRPIVRHHVGTIYDQEDDHKYLSQIESCLSIVVPIMVYDHEVEDILEDGVPTNPEWHPLYRIRQIRNEIVADPLEGPRSWRFNFLLDPSAGDGRMFPASLVKNSLYEKRKIKDAPFGIVYLAKKTVLEQQHDQHRARRGLPPIEKKPVVLNPMTDLVRIAAIDPGFSEQGDPWSIQILGSYKDECTFQLQAMRGRGWEALKAAMRFMFAKWRPAQIPYDRSAAQEAAFKALFESHRDFKKYERLLVPVSHRNDAKPLRIEQFVVEALRMKILKLDPADTVGHQKLIDYRPGPKADDNDADALAIGMSAKAHRGATKHWKSVMHKREARKRRAA